MFCLKEGKVYLDDQFEIGPLENQLVRFVCYESLGHCFPSLLRLLGTIYRKEMHDFFVRKRFANQELIENLEGSYERHKPWENVIFDRNERETHSILEHWDLQIEKLKSVDRSKKRVEFWRSYLRAEKSQQA